MAHTSKVARITDVADISEASNGHVQISSAPSLLALPPDLLLCIAQQLQSPHQIAAFEAVSRAWRQVSHSRFSLLFLFTARAPKRPTLSLTSASLLCLVAKLSSFPHLTTLTFGRVNVPPTALGCGLRGLGEAGRLEQLESVRVESTSGE